MRVVHSKAHFRLLAVSTALSLGISGIAVAAQAAPTQTIKVSAQTSAPVVEVEGTLRKAIIDRQPDVSGSATVHAHEDNPDDVLYGIQVDDTIVPVTDTQNELADIPTGAEVTATIAVPDKIKAKVGIGSGSTIDSNDASSLAEKSSDPFEIESIQTQKVPARALRSRAHNVYVAVATPNDAAKTGMNKVPSSTHIRSVIKEAETYWSRESKNVVKSLPVKAIKPLSLNRVTTTQLCNYDDPFGIWDEAARQWPSVDFNSDAHLIVVTAPCKEYAALGVAAVGEGINSGGPILLTDVTSETLIHELGHNYSLGHSNIESVVRGTPSYEYAGFFSPMAGGGLEGKTPALDVGYQHKLGFLPSNQITSVLGTKTVNLAPVSASSGVRAATFVDPASGDRVYVEYRNLAGSDNNAFYRDGFVLNANNTSVRNGKGIRVYALDNRDPYGLTYNDVNTFYQPAPAGTGYDMITTLQPKNSVTSPTKSFKVTAGNSSANSAAVTITVAKTTPAVKASSAKSYYGTSASVQATVTSKVPASGTLDAYVGSKKVGSAKIAAKAGAQKVTVKLSKSLAVGKNKVSLRVPANAAFNAASTTTTVAVSTARPKVSVKVSNSYWKHKPKATISVKSGIAPSGKATVYVDGKKYKTVTVKKGKAGVALSSKLKKGKHSIKVSFSQTKTHKSASTTSSFKVTHKKGKVTGFKSGTQKVKYGKKYSDTFTVNNTAVLQKKSGSSWKTVKKLKAGKHTISYSAKAGKATATYRIRIATTSSVKGTTTKSATFKSVR
ncbi:hypothetical protein [Timonella sp. A28]|uniref:hypothetical protein n=1 Tax=Timonella sp. A28 TaxID=3442640 RepID=UPI003EBDC3B1